MSKVRFRKYEKQRLQKMFDISASTLGRLLNDQYFTLLEPLGYKKHNQHLTPKQFAVLIEHYGEPINNDYE